MVWADVDALERGRSLGSSAAAERAALVTHGADAVAWQWDPAACTGHHGTPSSQGIQPHALTHAPN